jgi:hypothetical protein
MRERVQAATCNSRDREEPRIFGFLAVSRRRRLFEGDFVDCLLDLVDDHVGQLGALLAVQSLT